MKPNQDRNISTFKAGNGSQVIPGFIYVDEAKGEIAGASSDDTIYFCAKRRREYRGGYKQIPAAIVFPNPFKEPKGRTESKKS